MKPHHNKQTCQNTKQSKANAIDDLNMGTSESLHRP